MSLKSAMVMYRVEGVNGLKTLTGIKSNRLGQNNFVALFESHDGLFPIGSSAGLGGSLSAGFAAHVHRVDPNHSDLEQLLHRISDLRLVGPAVGDDSILIVLFGLARALFGQTGGLNNFKSVHRPD